ncbi:AMP-binding enzyme [Dictyocaulus viviparus]|uniref:AMP-binding enzyme n=1 Tax=Dictyocaulus viviparus TaxID=29172 RepID=A0A0D8Y7M4_DICVI|nr:AMP-binding enzyme [Dictyocaulus viviparus]
MLTIDPETGVTLTFEALPEIVKKIRHQIFLKGIEKGCVVASVCNNSIGVILTYLAAIHLSAIVVPINPASKKYEIEEYLTKCDVQFVLTENEYVNKLSVILKQSKYDTISIVLLEKLLELNEVQLTQMDDNLFEPDLEDTAFIFFSSGTTGPPKLIRHSHRSLIAHLRQVSSIMNDNSMTYQFPRLYIGDRIYGVLPYFHSGGLITVFCMLFQGATVVINKKWNDKEFLQVIQDFKITAINIVPTIMTFLLKSPLVDAYDLSSLRLIYIGAAKCDETDLRRLKHHLPKLRDVIQIFGMTETGMLIFLTPSANRALSSVGRAMPGVEAKVFFS